MSFLPTAIRSLCVLKFHTYKPKRLRDVTLPSERRVAYDSRSWALDLDIAK